MLNIEKLQASVDNKPILNGLDLKVNAGEVHAIMGPNGSGKSTLAHILAGREGYSVTGGTVSFEGEDLLALETEERARRGVFLAMQYPVELPGVNNMVFMKTALNAVRAARGEAALDAVGFMKLVRERLGLVQMDERFLKRNVNAGFSGGEKKRNEILQMAMLEPKLAILDETDSGLDIDALRTVAAGVNHFAGPDMGVLIITHYQRILHLVEPDRVHVMHDGRIVKSGGPELVSELEEKGYGWIKDEVGATT